VIKLYDYLIVAGSGGHTSRAIKLAKMLPGKVCFIIPYLAEVSKQKIKNDYFAIPSPRFRAKSNLLMTIFRTLFLFFVSFIILLFTRVRAVFSTGAGIAFPVLLAAKVLRKKTVYIESPSRVYIPSATGKLLLGKVDLWLGSWLEITKYENSIKYMGLLE
jgi:UDP-N-acetylglucosamine:LPS N-acetylglucosamine transferase